MIMAIRDAVIAARAISKSDFTHETFFLQISQRVVNGGEADPRHSLLRLMKNFGSRRMHIFRAYNIEHDSPLPREPRGLLLFLAT